MTFSLRHLLVCCLMLGVTSPGITGTVAARLAARDVEAETERETETNVAAATTRATRRSSVGERPVATATSGTASPIATVASRAGLSDKPAPAVRRPLPRAHEVRLQV